MPYIDHFASEKRKARLDAYKNAYVRLYTGDVFWDVRDNQLEIAQSFQSITLHCQNESRQLRFPLFSIHLHYFPTFADIQAGLHFGANFESSSEFALSPSKVLLYTLEASIRCKYL